MVPDILAEVCVVTKRRFDTDVLLEQVLAGDKEAFRLFYERYRARVYRFITRQYDNGEEGSRIYRSVWAQLVAERLHCKDVKTLKIRFLTGLQRDSQKPPIRSRHKSLLALTPRDLEDEGGWSTLLIELIRRLPEGLRQRYLFRCEIGLNPKAIATIFEERPEESARLIQDAERILLDGLLQVGCKQEVSLEKLYQETRILKPPASWDQEVTSAYPLWFEEGVPAALLQRAGQGGKGGIALVQGLLRRTIRHIRPTPNDNSMGSAHNSHRRS